MTYDSILKHVARHITLDEEEAQCFSSLLAVKEVDRKDYLLQEKEVCNTISYVHSGALRAYYLGKDGKESTIMFAIADWWITDMYCFLNQLPAMMYIEAIEDSCIFQLSKEHFDQLFAEVPKFERFFRILMQNAYTREQLRVIQNLSQSAEERYHNFLQKYPVIAQQVTQKQIASYLGITPEFLSAIRKNPKRGSIS
ncbi:MAG: Crp/Fnr family transcriptional regulator [Cyclobacteriaceae bacterium]|jgi:CRP-like cAMP-binding protein